jgi:hypothetical protein
MPFDGQGQILGRHADAIVGNDDEAGAALAQRDIDASGTGIDGILDQLLDRRRRTLHHLAGGDAVDESLRQPTDGHSPDAICAK